MIRVEDHARIVKVENISGALWYLNRLVQQMDPLLKSLAVMSQGAIEQNKDFALHLWKFSTLDFYKYSTVKLLDFIQNFFALHGAENPKFSWNNYNIAAVDPPDQNCDTADRLMYAASILLEMNSEWSSRFLTRLIASLFIVRSKEKLSDTATDDDTDTDGDESKQSMI